jgi:hypothetical protein
VKTGRKGTKFKGAGTMLERMRRRLAPAVHRILLAGSFLFLTAVIVGLAAEQHEPAARGAEEFLSQQPGADLARHADTTASRSALRRAGIPRARKAAQCSIKAIAWPNGSRFYLVPTDHEFYEHHIDFGRGDRCFSSEAEARAAGWRRSKGADVRIF